MTSMISAAFSRFALLATLVSTAAVIGTAGCTKRSQNIEVEFAGGTKATLDVKETFRIQIASEPPSLDWHKSTDTTSSQMTSNLMEGLTAYDLSDKELNLIPALATKWEASNQAKTWKFTIREGVVWSDGQAFTPQHVIDGFRRLLAKETTSEYAYFLFGIKNAQAFNQGKVPWEEVGAKITAPNEITIELEKSMGYFPMLLTHHSTYPARLDVIQRGGDRWTEPANLVTLGPFNLKAWQHDKQIVMERNDKYYGTKPSFRYIVAYMIQEQATSINLFDSGKLDAVQSLPSIELRKLRARKEFREHGTLSLYYYGMNSQKPPMDNINVRKAVSMAIDRQQIVQMLAGGQVPMTSWIPSGMFGYEADRGLSFNPEKAKELLKVAGFADPTKLPKIEIHFNTSEDHQRVAENVQAQLKKNLGINVELKNAEWKVYLNTLKTDPPQLYRFGWLADYPDPNNFMEVLASYSENNRTRWTNPRFDELVKKGAGETNKEERKKIYSEAQKILVEEDVPIVPLYTSVSHYLVGTRVENYPINAMNVYSYKGVKLK